MLPENLGHLFDSALKLTPDVPALLQDETVVTFRQLEGRTSAVARALLGLGVGPGDRVALLFTNHWKFIESLLGPMRLGAVPVPLNTRMGDEALGFVLSDSEATVVIANEETAERALKLCRGAPSVRAIVADVPESPGLLPYEPLLESAAGEIPRRRTAPDEIAMQPYTSGSTGKPKGVLLTHGGQIWNADILRKEIHVDDTERALVSVPLYHKNAMAGAVKPFLLGGGSLAILPGFDPRRVIEAIDRYRVTYLTGVPAMYKRILAETETLARHDVSCVRYAVCGSAEVPQELLDEFHRVFGAPMAESYGLTEGGPVPLINPRWGLKRRGSCGMAFPGCDVKLLSEDGSREVAAGEVGELVTRNPGLARGYWKRPEATATRFRDGWLHTGDLMRRDEDGFYYFLGRKDDMINVGGENVYPKEVEDLLLRHPNLRDVAVVPASHPVKGAVPVAFVVEREPGKANEDEVKAFFLERGAPYAHPRRVFFVDALPLGGTGKIDRSRLRELAREKGA
jgi:acyl-CoA synthetase (AMP-forming)/AMP-acid ligase II